MSIIAKLREYIETCPHLQNFIDTPIVNIDKSVMNQPTTYSINEVICNPVIKTFINGDEQRQFLFTFSSVESYGSDESLNNPNISNLEFYENFLEWIKDNSRNKVLPTLEGGKEAHKIEVLTGGYLFNNAEDGTTALYQAQLKLIYFQPK